MKKASSIVALLALLSSAAFAAPTAGEIPDETEVYGTDLDFDFPTETFSGFEDNNLTYSTTNLPAGVVFTPSTRTFTGEPDDGVGTYTVTVTATHANTDSASTDFDIIITKALLTVTADDKSIANGDAIPALTDTITGFVNGETLGTSGVTGTAALSTTATQGAGVNTYPITAAIGTLAADNYSFSFVDGTLTMTNNDPVVDNTIPDQGLVYGVDFDYVVPANTFSDPDLDALTYSATNVPAGVTFTPGTQTFSGQPTAGVGTYTITVTVTDINGGMVSDIFDLTYTKAVLTVTADDKSIANGDAIPALTDTITGFVNSETLGTSGVTGTSALSTTATQGAGVNTYPITAAIGTLASDNYSFNFVDGTLTMTNNDPVVDNAIPDQGLVYGVDFDYVVPANTFSDPDFDALTYSATNVPAGVTFTPGTQTFSGQPSAGVDTYTITVTVTDTNGGMVSDIFDLTYTKALLTVTADDKSIANGDAIPALTDTITGFVNSETLGTSGVTGTAALSTTATQGAGVNTYPITAAIGTLAADNYSFSFVDGTLTMTNNDPVIDNTIPDQGLVYGVDFDYVVPANTFSDPDLDALTYSATNVPAGVTFTPGTQTFSGQPSAGVDTYTITVTVTDINGGMVSDIFDLTYTKAVLTVTADDKSIANGDAIPALTDTITGFVNSETLGTSGVTGTSALSTTATQGAGVNTYPITAAIGTLASDNYSFNFVDGTLTMTNNDPVVDNAIPDQGLVYGVDFDYVVPANTFSDPDFDALTYSATNVPAGVTFTPGTQTFSGQPSAGVDTYTITVTVTDINGGMVSDIFDLTYTKAVLTVTADDKSIANGDAIPALTDTITGFVNSETLGTSGVTGSAALSTTATQGAGVNTYPITAAIGTLAADNYSFSFVDGTLTMTNNDPVVDNAIPDQGLVYGVDFDYVVPANTFSDPDLDALTYSATNVPAGVTFTPGTQTFSGQPSAGVGTYTITVTVTDINGGMVSDIFDLTYTKAVLTVTADDKEVEEGDAIPALTDTITGFVNSETLGTTGVTGTPALSTTGYQGASAGTYPITAAIGSLAADNYSFSFTAGTLTINEPPMTFSFNSDTLSGISELSNPTSLVIGPDDKLYISQQDGLIRQMVINRTEAGDYWASNKQTITLVQDIQNYDDDGTVNNSVDTRQVTALLASGTPANPILYVTSSDPRIGGGGEAGDVDLDTNSGILSRLTWDGSQWVKVDLIRGLPRSEENHSVNGMQLDESTNELYLSIGGMTNGGAPSNNFAFITEYALAAAIVRIDLDAIDAMPVLGTAPNQYVYDLPTLDDPTRAGSPDNNDPFGGNDGLNQAILDPSGPIEIYSPGYRNAYDLVITEAGRLYTWDNGGNQGWGGFPDQEGATDTGGGVFTTSATNDYVVGEPGSNGPYDVDDDIINNLDGLHLVADTSSYVVGSYYGGHPNPVRANPSGAGLYTHDGTSGTFRTTIAPDPELASGTSLPLNWPPIPLANANPIEGDFQNPGVDDQSLFTFESSTNGMAEYTASNFGGALQGDLLAVSYDGAVYRVDIDDTTGSISGPSDVSVLATGFGIVPLDVIAQADDEIYPGTIWVASYVTKTITIFEPADFECEGTDDPGIDEDGDGYMNADEIDAGTSPCSASSTPTDADGDFVSDYNDPDDDNDGILDSADFFPLDEYNGLATQIPVEYELLNGDPGFGFFGLGFTGLMHDGVTDYANLIADENNSDTELIAGGAVGLLTMNDNDAGDALGGTNTQKNGFQFGVNVMATTPAFTVSARTLGPFFVNGASGNESMGIFIGDGSQDDYIKIVIDANSGTPGISVVSEVGGVSSANFYLTPGVDAASEVFLRLEVDPSTGDVQPSYAVGNASPTDLGSPIAATGALLQSLQSTPALAIGVISTSRNSAVEFNATWEELFVTYDDVACNGIWDVLSNNGGDMNVRHEAAYTAVGDELYLVGGRGSRPLDIYDPETDTWSTGATPPVQFHHFQAVELDGELWVAGAFIGDYPDETPLSTIYIYNPDLNQWRTGPTIPRPRGSAGVAAYNGKLYIVSGLTDGHNGGHVAWFDCYDPILDTWTQLADAPRSRDHFHTQVIGNKLWMASGRQTDKDSPEGVFGNTVDPVDYYDFNTSSWSTLSAGSNIPTPRAGAMAAALGNELIIAGGESNGQVGAHDEVEALDTTTETWRSLPDLTQGRHSSGLAELDGRLYIASGSGNRGGGPELDQQEVYLPCSIYEPEISADVSELDFESEPGLSSTLQVVTLTNTGLYPLTIGSATATGSEFQIQITPATTLQPGGQTTISLDFNPPMGAIDDIFGELSIFSNATNDPILNVTLNGELQLNEPTLNIISPANSTVYTTGETIHISGSALSFEGDDISEDIQWSSDVDGAIGTGAALSFAHLSPGTHTLTAEVADSMGVDTDTSISISVLETVHAAINSGGSAYTSSTGVNYAADNFFTAGNTFSVANPISGTVDDTIYQSERWNPGFGYDIPLSPGNYRLVLMFAEIFDQIEAEDRFFDVELESVQIIDRYDILVQSGGLFTAIDLEFDFTLADSNVDIDFIVDLENPKINGLRIVDPYPLPYTTVISSPKHNQSFPTGKSIHFEASGEGTATWTSDIDGLIGSGTTLDFSGLTEGSHTITLEMTAPSTEQRQVTIDIDIVEPYAFWRDQQTWGGGDDTKTGDPDSDLVENDLERIFGMNPLVYDRHLLPYSAITEIESTDYFTYTYRRNLDVTDLDYWLDSTIGLELNNWSPETLTPSNHELMNEEGSVQTYRFRHPINVDPKRFFRLRVE